MTQELASRLRGLCAPKDFPLQRLPMGRKWQDFPSGSRRTRTLCFQWEGSLRTFHPRLNLFSSIKNDSKLTREVQEAAGLWSDLQTNSDSEGDEVICGLRPGLRELSW